MSSQTFPTFYEHQAMVKERMRQPIQWEGESWYPTAVAAELSGWDSQYLRVKIRDIPGDNIALTTPDGIRFVRLPRGRGDRRPPFYWDLESLKAAGHPPPQGRPRKTEDR